MTATSTNTDADPEFSLRVLRPQEVTERWPEISGLLERAIEYCHGDLELDDIKVLMDDGKAFILLLEKDGRACLASACEVIEYPRRRVLNVIATAGERLDLVTGPFWHLVADIGRQLGAQSVRGSVRSSMQRLYRRIAPDATVAYNILERTL